MIKTFFSSKPLTENSIVLIRLVAGILILVHGMGTFNPGHMEGNVAWLSDLHFPAPTFLAYLGKVTELVGGALVILGLFTRIACCALIFNMAVITFVLGSGKIFADDQLPFLLLVLFTFLLLAGPGKLSLDHLLPVNNNDQ